MRKHRQLCLLLLFSFLIGTLASCGSPGQQTGPVEFSPDVLAWGMSQQEVLEALGLTENDAEIKEREFPADQDRAARTRTNMFCRLVFDQIPIEAQFVFQTTHAESEWELGLSRLSIELCEDSPGTVSILREAVAQSTLDAISLGWEELSESQQQIMNDYYKATYPGYRGGLLEFGGITAVGGQGVSDKEGCYYTLQWEGEYVAVWNRFAKDIDKP